ncbi:hypothetical protein COO91_09178 (plasmid) [Nostoc flagelliforme CCNUN1]|uniref:Uncharacterized protein n=1 Tax=Nostoc flagelliforme CCNUN1 TaxID=2038116 RepID=A0A2K8T5P3_9NOSO|nr:hypothetical protein COO91_09178 [Nostoc flagelliforme CCNUN1]
MTAIARRRCPIAQSQTDYLALIQDGGIYQLRSICNNS